MCLTSLWSTEPLPVLQHIKTSAAHPSEMLWGSEAASWIRLLKSTQHWKCDVRVWQNTIQQECRTPGLKSCNPNMFCDLLSSLDNHLHPETGVYYLGEEPQLDCGPQGLGFDTLILHNIDRVKIPEKNHFQISTDEAEKLYPYRIYVTHFLHEKEKLLKCINIKTNGRAATCWEEY